MQFDDGLEPVIPSTPGNGRKRKTTKENHERQIIKKARHSGDGKTPGVGCGHRHTVNAGLCHADKLSNEDIQFNFRAMYSSTSKTDQDQTIIRLATVSEVIRERVSAEEKKKRDVSVKYCLLSSLPPHTRIPVCKTTFQSVLGIKDYFS